jgi:CRP/FNR family cyclic AMP-dependent transcriptional regulator
VYGKRQAYYDRRVRLRHDAKTDLLKSVPLFSGCSKQELRELASVADEIDLREGTSLTKEGAAGREFVVIVEGTAEVTKDGRKVAELGPGDWLGEIALITKSPRTATVTASTPVRILVVTDRAFRQVVEQMPGIAIKVLEKLGERLAADAQGDTAKTG